jgi:Domain of unknown function (DUF4157)
MFAQSAKRIEWKPEAVKPHAWLRPGIGDQRARNVAREGRGLRGEVQAKLSVGAVNDPLEAEADRIADQVMHRPGSAGNGNAGRQSAGGLRHEGSVASSSELLSGAGRPLDTSARAFFEPRFGLDFSRVRIFSDEQAARSAQSIGALAYTAGPNIAFGGGLYQPGTGDGRRLLAHELTHVVQQGHAAAMDGHGVNVAVGRAIPAIQRDTPPGATKQGGPLSVTKRYDPDNASREEVVQALTNYLTKELALQGTRQLAVTDRVRWAVLKLFQGNPVGYGSLDPRLSKAGLPESPAEFAKLVGKELPDFIPRKHMTHLDVPPVRDADPTSISGKAKQTIKEKFGELGKPPPDVGTANRPAEAPSNEPTIGSNPTQHDIQTPEIPFGDPTRKVPNPNLPQAPVASDQEAVKKIVQALDDDALVPAAYKRTPQAAEFGSAKLLAQSIANKLAAAEAKKQYTVEVTIGMNYRGVADLGEIFGKIESIVRQIAAVLPGGVKDVNEVVITLPRAGNRDKYPARRVVKLHGGD